MTYDPLMTVMYAQSQQGQGIGYTPQTIDNWQAPAPDNVHDAIERLAAAVSGLLVGPIP